MLVEHKRPEHVPTIEAKVQALWDDQHQIYLARTLLREPPRQAHLAQNTKRLRLINRLDPGHAIFPGPDPSHDSLMVSPAEQSHRLTTNNP